MLLFISELLSEIKIHLFNYIKYSFLFQLFIDRQKIKKIQKILAKIKKV